MITRLRQWLKNNERICNYCLAFFASLTFCIDLVNLDVFWKNASSIMMPFFVFCGVLYLVKQNRLRVKNKPLTWVAFFFSFCQIIATFYSRSGTLTFAFVNFAQIVKVLLVFVGYTICFYQIVKYLLAVVHIGRDKLCTNRVIRFVFDKYPFWVGLGLVLLAYLPLLFVFYPGIVQNDTFDELSQYYCIGTWSNDYIVPEYEDSCINTHHSPFHTMMVGFVNDSVYSLTGKANYALFANVVVQALLAVVIFAYTLKIMRGLKTPYWLRFLTIIIYCFLPYFNMWAITVAKDVPFSLMVVVYVCFLIEFFAMGHCGRKNLVKILIGSILLLLLSNKSIFFIVPISIMIIFVIKPRYRFLMGILPLVLYVLYLLVVLPSFHINSGSVREPLALPIQQVSSVFKTHEEELSDDERNAVQGILDYSRIDELYNSTTIDPIKNNLFNKYYSQDDLMNFLRTWFALGWKYPINYMSSFLHLYSVNLWVDGNNGVAYFRTERSRDDVRLDYKTSKWRKEKANELEKFYNEVKKMPFIGILFHNAFYLWCVIVVFVMMICRKKQIKNVIVIFLPIIVMAFFLFVSPVANNKRYFLPIIYCVPIIIAYYLYSGKFDEKRVIVYNDTMGKIRDFISVVLSPLKKIYGWAIFHCFWFLPLNNKVVFSCFRGKRYGDSPRYISERLHERYPEIEQIWIYDQREFDGLPKNVKQVKWRSLKMMKELATAKVWVDSHYLSYWIFKRKKGQTFIETWHGGIGLKKIGLDVPYRVPLTELMSLKKTAKTADYWISDSDWSTKIHRRANNYKGEILKIGLPRIDFLISDKNNSRNRVCKHYNIPKRKKIVLYIPTMRYNPCNGDFVLDIDVVSKALREKFGGDWVFIVRLHPANQDIQRQLIDLYGDVYDGLKYDDIQDLIASADICISDYSSAIFDSAILGHPTFCYAFDMERYEEKERGFYQKLKELPFPVARDNNELCREIVCFNEKKYRTEMKKYFKEAGLYEPKDSTEKVVEIIMGEMNA